MPRTLVVPVKPVPTPTEIDTTSSPRKVCRPTRYQAWVSALAIHGVKNVLFLVGVFHDLQPMVLVSPIDQVYACQRPLGEIKQIRYIGKLRVYHRCNASPNIRLQLFFSQIFVLR